MLGLRAARLEEEEILAVDSTSRSAWGDNLADIHWGRNKDHLPLPQTKEVVAYTLTSHMPVYYRTFSGNMPDSRSLPVILADMDHAGFKDVIFDVSIPDGCRHDYRSKRKEQKRRGRPRKPLTEREV